MKNGAGVLRGARLAVFLALLPAAASAAPADEALSRAGRERLWEETTWLRLLHVKPGRWGGAAASDALPGAFFLAPDGRRDARAELEADVRALFDGAPDPLLDKSGPPEPARCRYPARVAWLAERLSLDGDALLAPCGRFKDWARRMDASGVTMVFASAFLSNPSSMFGHTFLRMDRPGLGADQRLLDNTLNYAAETPEQNGVFFAVKGLLGLYPGVYTAMPYYLKAQEYGNIDKRDLWEYRLDLSSAEVSRLVAHAWEMGHAVFPYYFFSKNCSYQLMPALEAAAPRLSLMPGSPAVVAPTDTLLALLAVPGLVRGVGYRPSESTLLRQRRAALDAEERAAARDYVRGDDARADALLSDRPPARRAAVLDAAEELLLFQHGFSPDVPAEVKEREHPILVRRSRLDVPSSEPPRPAWAAPPEEGHPRRRLLLGAGGERGGPFAELGWRPGLHALEDRPRGYLPGSAITGFSARLRYDAPTKRLYAREARLVDIVSLTPFDTWTRKPSWSLGTGLTTAFETGAPPPDAWVYEGHLGTGLAFGPFDGTRLAAVLGAGEFAAGPVLRGGGRLGGGLRLAAYQDWGRLHAVLEGGLSGYILGDRRPNHRLRTVFDWALSRGRALRAEFLMQGPHREALLDAVLYH